MNEIPILLLGLALAACARAQSPLAAPAPALPQKIEAKAGATYRDVTHCAPDGMAQKMDLSYPRNFSDKPILVNASPVTRLYNFQNP